MTKRVYEYVRNRCFIEIEYPHNITFYENLPLKKHYIPWYLIHELIFEEEHVYICYKEYNVPSKHKLYNLEKIRLHRKYIRSISLTY